MAEYERNFKEKLDDIYFEVRNKLSYTKFSFEKLFKGKHKQLKKNIELKDIHKGERCFVIGNGPSINDQDLTLLKNEIVFMVNRAFLHPDYEVIKPKYHVIVDPKLATGEWEIKFLDRIAEKNPDVTFLLNSAWYDKDIFQPYKKKYTIYWIDQSLEFTPFINKRKIDLTTKTYSKFVVEQAITASIYMGVSKTYFTGVEGNGLAYTMLGKDSHSYGSNLEDLNLTWSSVAKSYQSGSIWLKNWHNISRFCEQNNIKLINLTKGGIMTMAKRDDFFKVVKNRF
jgi:hypothetical protein